MAVFTDDFTGTDAQALEDRTGWTLDGIAGGAQIASNQLRCATTNSAGSAYQAQSAGSADHYGQADIVASGQPFGVCVRVVDTDSYIGARWNSDQIQVFKRVSGTFTALGSFANFASSTIKLEITGTSLDVFRDATEELSNITVSDAVFSGVQTPGCVARSTAENPWIDNWESDALAGGGGSTTPQSIAATAGSTATVALKLTFARTIAATAGSTATVSPRQVILQAIAATAGSTATVVKKVKKNIAAVAGSTATLVKKITHTIDATAGSTASLDTTAAFKRSIAATAGSTATVAALQVIRQAISAVAGATATVATLLIEGVGFIRRLGPKVLVRSLVRRLVRRLDED